jgi:hypothetical protein
MAVTLAKAPSGSGRGEDVWGRRNVHLFQVTFDGSYPTGGEVLGLSAAGVADKSNARYFFSQRAPLTGGYQFVYDRANDKLLVFWVDTTTDGAALAQVADTTDLSALIVDILVIED